MRRRAKIGWITLITSVVGVVGFGAYTAKRGTPPPQARPALVDHDLPGDDYLDSIETMLDTTEALAETARE